MSEQQEPQSHLTDLQLSALIFCGAVVVGFILYWSLEIQSAREMLELAYGG